MTAADWFKSERPDIMLTHVCRTTSERKLGLFSCACCRQVWKPNFDPRLEIVLEIVERYADGEATEKERIHANNLSEAVRHKNDRLFDPSAFRADQLVAEELQFLASWYPMTKNFPYVASRVGLTAAYSVALTSSKSWQQQRQQERSAQAALVRDLIGNPFQPVVPEAAWYTANVVALAQSIYASRDFSTLPILADALQDAGCTDEALLSHCLTLGEHARGCWVLDLLLGKA